MGYEYGIGNWHFSKCTFSTVLHLPSYNLKTISCMEKRKNVVISKSLVRGCCKKLDFDVLRWMVGLCIDGHTCPFEDALQSQTHTHAQINTCTHKDMYTVVYHQPRAGTKEHKKTTLCLLCVFTTMQCIMHQMWDSVFSILSLHCSYTFYKSIRITNVLIKKIAPGLIWQLSISHMKWNQWYLKSSWRFETSSNPCLFQSHSSLVHIYYLALVCIHSIFTYICMCLFFPISLQEESQPAEEETAQWALLLAGATMHACRLYKDVRNLD